MKFKPIHYILLIGLTVLSILLIVFLTGNVDPKEQAKTRLDNEIRVLQKGTDTVARSIQEVQHVRFNTIKGGVDYKDDISVVILRTDLGELTFPVEDVSFKQGTYYVASAEFTRQEYTDIPHEVLLTNEVIQKEYPIFTDGITIEETLSTPEDERTHDELLFMSWVTDNTMYHDIKLKLPVNEYRMFKEDGKIE